MEKKYTKLKVTTYKTFLNQIIQVLLSNRANTDPTTNVEDSLHEFCVQPDAKYFIYKQFSVLAFFQVFGPFGKNSTTR